MSTRVERREGAVAVQATGAVPHLYVHFPFCARKCPYCDFNSHAGRDAETDAYLAALDRETRARATGLRPRTIFVGGGTPTHTDAGRLERWLVGLRETVGDEALLEFTVEANPGTLTRDKLSALRRAGVDRLSVGVQSFEPRHLATLGRIHSGDEARRALGEAREAGFRRVNLDLMLALPGQTLDEQRSDLETAIALDPDHLSAYALMIEPGTAFEKMLRVGRLLPQDPDRDLEHLVLARRLLEEAGYRRYEISNYARPGQECLHNLGYWRNADWLGLGAGAHSYVAGARWKNVDDPARYAREIVERGDAVEWTERPTARTVLFETLMMGLRLVDGVDLEEVSTRTGLDVRALHGETIRRHVDAGLLVEDRDRVRLTERGMDLSSYVTRSFLPAED